MPQAIDFFLFCLQKHTQEHKDAINLWELYSESKNNILNPDTTDDDKESLASSNRDVKQPLINFLLLIFHFYNFEVFRLFY